MDIRTLDLVAFYFRNLIDQDICLFSFADHFTPDTQDKEIGLFNPSQPSGKVFITHTGWFTLKSFHFAALKSIRYI